MKTKYRYRRVCVALLALTAFAAGPALAHSPIVDSSLTDWCLGAFSNTAQGGGRVEDSYAELTCGNCSVSTTLACKINSDCPAGQTCVNMGSRVETVWWDNRTDGAVNDLGTVAVTQDNTNIYFSAQLWVDPDPVSLPFGEIGIDAIPGAGISTWHDPGAHLVAPGNCSVSTDRACTSDADCHFCAVSTEPFPSTRVRTCGSGCDPDDPADVCETTQTCLNLGATGLVQGAGQGATINLEPDYLIVFDFSRWLVGQAGPTLVMKDVGGAWTPQSSYEPAVNPGASGGSGGPPGAVEVAIPWSAFGCTGCPAACSCPDFGPGVPFRFSIIIARGTLTLDYTPDGAIEDVMSEPIAGISTVSGDSCPGMGIGTTACELADGSSDGFIPPAAAVPGGRTSGLIVEKGAGDEVTLTWGPSCSAADSDYGVYEGQLGNWYSHAPVAGLCSTGGNTMATFDASTGNRYFLIVPNDGATEGSYGEDSDGIERPVGAGPCDVQSLGNCP